MYEHFINVNNVVEPENNSNFTRQLVLTRRRISDT
jgi:hypothetical protein